MLRKSSRNCFKDTNQHVSVVESAGADGGKVFIVSDNVAGDEIVLFYSRYKGLTGITENSTATLRGC